jgi:tRNA threonylcarbamoyladenosine biosynthesis protein TsaB
MTTGAHILAIETSTPVTRVVVVDARTGVRMAAAEAVAERHSANLLRLCVDTAEQAGVRLASGGLAAIACGAGPGSFTGLRVGLAVAKGLAMPTSVPLLLISSLEALALDMAPHVAPGTLMLPCQDAGKGHVFGALFDLVQTSSSRPDVVATTGEWSSAPTSIAAQVPADVAIAFAGAGARRYQAELEQNLGARARFVDVAGPTADAVARRAVERLARGESDSLESAVPSYGRAPDITRSKRAGR